MTAKSHVATSVCIAILPIFAYKELVVYGQDYMALYLMGVVIGSLFPDIDEEHSSIGRKVPLLSSFLNRKIGHRTLTHNLIIYLLIAIYVITALIYTRELSFVRMFALGFATGGILHILEDCLTNSGVRTALSPITQNFQILKKQYRFNTNSTFENLIYFPIICVLVLVELYLLFSSIFLG